MIRRAPGDQAHYDDEGSRARNLVFDNNITSRKTGFY